MTASELWRHSDPEGTQMWKFLQHVNSKYGLSLAGYPDLYKWSVDNVADFWGDVWHFAGIKASKPFDQVLSPDAPMFPRPDFFEGARLNFAENLLFPANADVDENAVAVITATEDDNALTETTWAELRDQVRRCSNALRAAGVKENSVVAGFVANHVQALVALLSASTLGAIWTGISPDNGVSAVLDRLVQIRPQVLFSDNATVYNGKEWSGKAKTLEIVEVLKQHGLETVVIIKGLPHFETGLDEYRNLGVKAEEYDAFLSSSPADEPLVFSQLPPSHPLYVLYSSGTTGLPKAIVHTAAGTLLQHKKELYLHCSVSPASRMLYFTTTSWMMHHWSVSALSCGSSLVLYSGSPFKPRGFLSLPILLSKLKVTHFGTSAAYLTTLEANNIIPTDPSHNLDLSPLEAIYSTASPLPPSTFSFVYKAFPSKINLASITGGTDIISLFGAPCPLLPVKTGEIQCAGLGMAIAVMDSSSPSAAPELITQEGEEGDLVCLKPFPCQPLTFFGPDGQEKYRSAYFERFGSNIWHHGDFVKIPDAKTGGLVMLGRSDGVLKPAGVRFGSAEIYNVLTRHFAGEVEEAVCVGRRRERDRDETVCLFVVMSEGRQFGPETKKKIAEAVRRELSARHVPGVIEEAGGGVPKTGNGKKIEVAVKQILSGMQVKTNASVANPEALEWFKEWARREEGRERLPN
ncbi:putative acetoacetyl-coenzyme A synthetase [Triangularia verruculosa]|uniref:Acetoacetyl-coenzyme A synthetase n=1 Tax=Triangularia verruculosa TaxID=2587418 RepID=A0AAN6XPC0_9PEZI|nr:putative acetoacetyl-coenzyme A synthetase [Triangularia verruculosa]